MEDFLKLDNLLTEEEKLIRHTVRLMVDTKVIPLMSDAYEKGIFPLELIKECANMGLFGMTLPAQWGGSDASQVAYGLVSQELERGDTGLRSFVSVQSSLCMYPIYQYGSQAQKEKYLLKMATGALIGCFGLTEPNAGSDPSSMTTRAKKVPGGYRINGSKLWITNATIAEVAIVWAKIEDDSIRGFIIEKPAFKANEIKHKLILRFFYL